MSAGTISAGTREMVRHMLYLRHTRASSVQRTLATDVDA
jgi:hypothetical protein